jgi:ACS family tartrate transporter-like MFS transporter
MEGLPAVILGAVVIFFLEDTPAEAVWLEPEERAWLLNELGREHPTEHPDQRPHLAAFKKSFIWILALSYFCLNTASYGISLWLPNVIHRLSGISEFGIGVLSTIPYIVAAVAMVLVGLHSDQTGERRRHVVASAWVGALALVLAAYSQSVAPVIATISVALLGVFAMMGPFWAIPTATLSRTEAAAGIAIINSVGNLGGFFGPYVVGLLKHATGDFRGGLLVIGGALAVSGALVLLPWVPAAVHRPATQPATE